MSVLNIKDFTLGIGSNIELVKNVNLNIEKGDFYGLIGESGSGKSLTAMSILKLLPPNLKHIKGSIILNIDDEVIDLAQVSNNSLRKLRGSKIGFVFQDPMTCLNPSIKCGIQVAEVLEEHDIYPSRQIKNEVLDLFQKVKLPDVEKMYNSYPHEISGGQRQRIMIAMAVACKPSLLIADEPTTALDVTVQKSIIELIDELRKSQGLAVLFISHDLGLISEYADYISIMYRGEIVESGEKSKILKSPDHPYTRGLIACKPPIDKKLHRLVTLDDVLDGKRVEPSIYKTREIKDKVLLEVKGLNTFYTLKRNLMGKVSDEMHALKNIDFTLYKNESLALVGESGSGKSTLGKSLLHLVESKSGDVLYNGISIREMSRRQFRNFRKKIQFIFQDPFASLNPKLIIGEAISEPLKVYGLTKGTKERKQKVHDLLRKVGLSESDYTKYPHQFSGGQRQRIVIARALTMEPEFIVCDEAVSALDVSVQAKILNLLKDLQEEYNLTYLFITHDMSVVRFFCDRMLVMKNGEIIERGRTEEIFKDAKQVFTKELIDASF